MINHIRSAATRLRDVDPYGAEMKVALAQAHATIALAEQAKIANRLALIAAHAAGGLTPGIRAVLDQINDELAE